MQILLTLTEAKSLWMFGLQKVKLFLYKQQITKY